MDFYEIDCQGPIYIEKVSTLPIWTPSDEGRMLYDEDTNNIYVGDNTSWILSSDVGDWNTILNKPTSLNDINSTEYNKLNNIEADANNYIHPNHTGDVSSIGDGTTIINNHVVTNSKLSNMPANTIKGRESSTGEPQDLNSSNARSAIGLGNIACEDFFISSEDPSGGYDGNVWYKLSSSGDMGIFGGGYTGSCSNIIDYIIISSIGNASDFGDLTLERHSHSSTSNGTNERGIFSGGLTTLESNIIDYITISSIGNASDFGDLTITRQELSATSNGTNERCIFGGGYYSPTNNNMNIIDYITISSISNAIDFGDLTVRKYGLGATSNGINDRGVFSGGYTTTFAVNIIDYIIISTIGNASDFGDLTLTRYSIDATSNGTNDRGVFGGSYNGTIDTNVIDYITISTTGDAIDFGDLIVAREGLGATSNGINDRGVFGGGGYIGSSVAINIIDYITISTIGDAIDFSDLTVARQEDRATSNA